ALDFVDRALGIADFIAPTLWQGIFSTVHIMKNLVPRPLEAAEEFVRLTGGTVLTRGKYIPFIHAQTAMAGACYSAESGATGLF
ncbi:MAG: hypothetical protein IIU45_01285, partial [Lachnospiraceae bacterium]|nr:hypothetical protein [Lachnospiraceae bacterium]